MSGYTDIDPADVPQFLTAAQISELFQKGPRWFANARVRKRLYAKGFPHPVMPGRWSPLSVRLWQTRAGENLAGVAPVKERRRRANGAKPGYVDP